MSPHVSPNKTWEGFLGAAVLTLIFSFYFPVLLAQYTWFTCPAEGLYIWPFPPPLVCEANAVFVETIMKFPYFGEMTILPIQIHGLAYGLFASLVAPFGGFFASAIKRAYKKKDFGSFMPGKLIFIYYFHSSFHDGLFISVDVFPPILAVILAIIIIIYFVSIIRTVPLLLPTFAMISV